MRWHPRYQAPKAIASLRLPYNVCCGSTPPQFPSRISKKRLEPGDSTCDKRGLKTHPLTSTNTRPDLTDPAVSKSVGYEATQRQSTGSASRMESEREAAVWINTRTGLLASTKDHDWTDRRTLVALPIMPRGKCGNKGRPSDRILARDRMSRSGFFKQIDPGPFGSNAKQIVSTGRKRRKSCAQEPAPADAPRRNWILRHLFPLSAAFHR